MFQDGMGKLRILKDGVRIEGDAEFLRALYAKHIRATAVSSNNLMHQIWILIKPEDFVCL